MDAVATFESAAEYRTVEERAFLDRLVHAHQVLVEAAARADRQMAHLRVPHLTGWQPRRLARGVERRVRVGAPELVEHRSVSQRDRVSRSSRSAAPAVEDDED